MAAKRDPIADLKRIAFLLEKANEATYRVRAFRNGASAIEGLTTSTLQQQAAAGTLRQLPGIGEVTERCIVESLAGEVPAYLARLEEVKEEPLTSDAEKFRQLLRGDCHTHSDWSDGGSPIQEMAETARELGHEYLALTDHSPRLTVANGLSAERLRRQLAEVAILNKEVSPFRILTGIEVDILNDGSLDQDAKLLAQLDIVVASVHSKLKDPIDVMTKRMLGAVNNPLVTILGHCTGRRIGTSKPRPESKFHAEEVFTACAANGVAVEINSRPDRLDPPKDLLTLAVEIGCYFSIDSDGHAPGQLDWIRNGCERAAACGVDPDHVINTWPAKELVAWAKQRQPF